MSVDLTTTYLGLSLKNPLIASAGPLTGRLDSLRRLEEAGIAAVVLPSLFEEQIEHEEMELYWLYEQQAESFGESLSYFPELEDYNTGPTNYLNHLEQAKLKLQIPIIASLNGCSTGGWVRYAKIFEDAGADAVELNIYFVPTDVTQSAADVERRYTDLVAAIASTVQIPCAVKIGPYFTSLPHFARQLVEAGASGLVLFNRYLAPDIHLDTFAVEPSLALSDRLELRTPLRWIAILRDQLKVSLALTSGVHITEDALKALLVGADAVMMTSVLMQRGSAHVATLLEEMEAWIQSREYVSVAQLKASMSRGNCPDPSALERANYMKALLSYTSKYQSTMPYFR